MADEAVSLFKCFYEQGNPNGNHSHLYMQLSMFFVVTSSNFFFSSGFCNYLLILFSLLLLAKLVYRMQFIQK